MMFLLRLLFLLFKQVFNGCWFLLILNWLQTVRRLNFLLQHGRRAGLHGSRNRNRHNMKLMFFFLAPINFRQVLIASRAEDKRNGQILHQTRFMPIEDNTDDNGEDLPCRNHKRDNVLLELLDHPIDEDLARCC